MLKLIRTCLSFCLIPLSAHAEAPFVATDIPPVHALVQGVMNGIGKPDLIMPLGADPHSYTMRPSEAVALERADIVFWIGDVLTPWLSAPVTTLATQAEIVVLSATPGLTKIPLPNGEGIDPHLWLDPNNALLWLTEISEHLVLIDPDNRDTYLANTAHMQQQIQTLIPKVSAILAPFEHVKYLTFHDSLGYFGQAFAVTPFQSITDIDSSQPSTSKLITFSALMSDNDITCLLIEPGASIAIVANMAPPSIKVVEAFPLGNAPIDAPDYYQRLILDLAQALEGCLTKSN